MKLGLLGEVLGHSLSPVIHEKLFQKLGISSTYELIEIPKDTLQKDLPALLASYDGLNVTIPYKVEVIPFLDELSKEAETIGAVNTIARKNGKLLGFNTDYTGFARTLSRIGCDVKGKKAVVLGHGGASRAIIQCLFDKGAGEIHVISRHPEKVGKDFLSFAEKRKVLIQGYDSLSAGRDNYLLVNATLWACTRKPEYPHFRNHGRLLCQSGGYHLQPRRNKAPPRRQRMPATACTCWSCRPWRRRKSGWKEIFPKKSLWKSWRK